MECGNAENNILLTEVKERCKEFLVSLCTEIQKRLPDNISTLAKITMLHPNVATSQVRPSITELPVAFKAVCLDIDATVKEWQMIPNKLWLHTSGSEEFWAEVSGDCDSGGNKRFEHISTLALALLTLPVSNATVERAFSNHNCIKTKLRNKMHVETAEAKMRIRYSLRRMNTTCVLFKPTREMLRRFTSQIYVSSSTQGGNEEQFGIITDALAC